MADYNSELPVRSQLPGQVNPDDIIVKIGDATNPTTQQAIVDAFGSLQQVIKNAAGNAADYNWGTVGAETLRVAAEIGNATGSADWDAGATGPQTLRVVANQGGSWSVNAVQSGTWTVGLSEDHDYGVVGSNTLRTAAEIGNATGAADFNYGVVGAQTLRTAAEIGNATGSADFDFGAVGAQTLRTAAEIGNATGAADFNYGAVSAQTLRVASQIGNATGAADFNNGATGAQTLRVAANLAVGGADVTPSNPVPVVMEAAPGDHINDFKDATAIAKGASDNHDYTVSVGKTFYLNQIETSASGVMKVQVQVETGVATGTFNTIFVQFNSTATPNTTIHLDDDVIVAAGVRVRVVLTNRDNAAMDLYSTICGYEV